MYELITLPGTPENETYGRDQYGEFGSLFTPESDLQYPELFDFQSDPSLEPTQHSSAK